MRQYKPGDEILPGVVYHGQCESSENHKVRLNDIGYNVLSVRSIEHLESIADELADLRARVPSEGDYTLTMNYEQASFLRSVLAVIGGSPTHSRRKYVSEMEKSMVAMGFRDWRTADIIGSLTVKESELPAPEKPKELTVADLPEIPGVDFVLIDSTEEKHSRPFIVDAQIGRRKVAMSEWSSTEHEAVTAALEAIKAGKLDRWLKQD